MGKQESTQSKVAKLIRAELKKEFPNTKFEVRSKSFSMGNSVDIDWTNGPTTDKVDNIVNKYQAGYFDGMEDMYVYNNNNADHPTVKYVMTARHMSKEVEQLLIKEHNEEWVEDARIDDIDHWNQYHKRSNHQVIGREFDKNDYM